VARAPVLRFRALIAGALLLAGIGALALRRMRAGR
jgi:hypothetical protein